MHSVEKTEKENLNIRHKGFQIYVTDLELSDTHIFPSITKSSSSTLERVSRKLVTYQDTLMTETGRISGQIGGFRDILLEQKNISQTK